MAAIGPGAPQLQTPIKTSSDEYIIKDYTAATIKKPEKGEAHLVVTNKRAIIYFWTKKAVLVNDAQITEVTASNIFWGKRSRRKAGLVALSIGIIGYLVLIQYNLALLSSLNDPYYGAYVKGVLVVTFLPGALILVIPIAIGIYLLVKQRTTFIVTLYVKSVTDAISLHNYPTAGGISGAMEGLLKPSRLKLEGRPGADAEVLAKEIGALILDIQQGIVKK